MSRDINIWPFIVEMGLRAQRHHHCVTSAALDFSKFNPFWNMETEQTTCFAARVASKTLHNSRILY
jgi:hypothetical protein